MVRVIYGPRRSGRTTKLIELCKTMNETCGVNNTVILAKDYEDAQRIYKMAQDMKYPSMPFPITFPEIQHMRGSKSWYKNLLIDDLDIFIQRLIGSSWNLAGYTIDSEGFLDEISAERLAED